MRVARVSRGFPARGGFATCLLLTCAPCFESFSFSSAPFSLSLCSSLIKPSSLWGLFLVGCSVSLGVFDPRVVPPYLSLLGACLCPSAHGGLASSSHSIPPSPWGPALLFPVAPTQSVLLAPSGALGGLPGSLLCLPPGSGSSSFHGSLWFWCGASAPFHASPTLSLSSAPWLFHRLLPPVSSVLPLLDSSLLCSLASWLVLGSVIQVLVETGPSSSAGVVSSASSSCLRGPLGCLLLLSTRGLPLVSVSLRVFQALRQVLFFSLVLQAFLSVSLHPVSVWSCFLGLLSFRSAVVPCSLIPLRCLPFHRLVTGPVWSQGFLYLSTLGPQYPPVVLRRLPSVRRSSLGYGPTRSLSLLRLFSPFLGGAALRAFLLFGFWSPLGSPSRLRMPI